MKTTFIAILLAAVSVIGLMESCKTTKAASDKASTEGCSTMVTVEDWSGKLAGCRTFFVMEDGSYLRPMRLAEIGVESSSLKDGQKYTIDYTELEGIMSSCMKGKAVQVTCLTFVE